MEDAGRGITMELNPLSRVMSLPIRALVDSCVVVMALLVR